MPLPAWNNVLGVNRPINEVVQEIAIAGLLGMAALGICDVLFALKTKGRWFLLHTIANIWISLLCLPDLWFLISDPLTALAERRTIHWPTSLVFSVHVYHVLFFRNLTWVDWLHHILMIAIGAPLLITGEVGPLMNFNNFWMCGVPGGLDYAMLFCVKQGWMAPLTEKGLNTKINVWLRVPFLVCTSAFGYIQFFLQNASVPMYVLCIRAFLLLLASWNGLFFMERVVGNYHVCEFKQAQKPTASSRSRSPSRAEYESEEHVTISALGMRTILSSKDLRELEKKSK